MFMERTTKFVSKTHLCCSVSFFMLLICILFFSSTTASAIACLDTRCPKLFKPETDFQQVKEEIGQDMVSQGKTTEVSMSWSSRRLLGGAGSSPPQCNTKCGKCTPCRPVRVPVQPGKQEVGYYPVAWRCMCRSKLYKP